MAFDLTCLATLKANSMSAISAAVGARLVTTFRSARRACRRRASCTRKPPATERNQARRADRGRPPASSSRRFFFAAKIASPLRRLGRDHHFGEDLDDLLRRRRVQRPVQRDDAAEGADRVAGERLPIGLEQVAPVATPQGLACLMMAMAGFGRMNSATSSKAASVSLMLL